MTIFLSTSAAHAKTGWRALKKKLTSLRQLARESYERLSSELTRTRKRAKDTSSAQEVLPATARAQPPAQRAYAMQGKQQLFSSSTHTDSAESSTGEIY